MRVITVTALVHPVQLLKVFPVTVFVAIPVLPSVLDQPAITVAPVTVILEKLLLILLTIAPEGEEAFVVKRVTVPPAPVLPKAVTIELPLIF